MVLKEFKENIVNTYSSYGLDFLDNGTVLVANAVYVAPFAYLHEIYAPLNNSEIDLLEKELGVNFPEELRNAYLEFNGVSLFINTIYIYGLRNGYQRSIEDSRQPYDIININTVERISGADKNILFFGGILRMVVNCILI